MVERQDGNRANVMPVNVLASRRRPQLGPTSLWAYACACFAAAACEARAKLQQQKRLKAYACAWMRIRKGLPSRSPPVRPVKELLYRYIILFAKLAWCLMGLISGNLRALSGKQVGWFGLSGTRLKIDDISHVDSTCTDASEQSEPSEPNGEPVWTAIHIRHAKICT